MLFFLSAFLHFVLTAANPQWSCELEHRDPGVAGTFYLYCSKMAPDGVELVDVGHFVSDEKAKATL
jgi:hypothetical protein